MWLFLFLFYFMHGRTWRQFLQHLLGVQVRGSKHQVSQPLVQGQRLPGLDCPLTLNCLYTHSPLVPLPMAPG